MTISFIFLERFHSVLYILNLYECTTYMCIIIHFVLGHFGKYQLAVFLLINAADFMTSWTVLSVVFTGASLPWGCGSNSNHTNSSISFSSHLHSASNISNTTMTSFDVLLGANVTNQTTDQTCLPNGEPCAGIEFHGTRNTIVSEWHLVCNQAYVSDLVTTIQMIGTVFGGAIISQLGDSFGRKKIWFINILVNCAVGFGQSFSTSWHMYAVFRFISGFCFAGQISINYVWPMEMVGERFRPVVSCVGFWQLGGMSLSLLAYLNHDWRNLLRVTSTVPLLLLALWWFLPESPRWLAMHKHFDEAEKVLNRIAKSNNKPPPDMNQLRAFVRQEEKRKQSSGKASYWDLCRTPRSTLNVLILGYSLFVANTLYFGTNYAVKNLSGDLYINSFLMGLVELPIILSTIFFNKWIGRKISVFGFMAVAGLSIFSVLFIDLAGRWYDLSSGVTGLILVGKAAVSGGWYIAALMVAELFPTVVRSVATGATQFISRMGLIVAPQIVYLSISVSAVTPYVVFGVLGITAALANLLLPETKNQPLQDSLPKWGWCPRKAEEKDKDKDFELVTSDKPQLKPDMKGDGSQEQIGEYDSEKI